MLPFGDPHLAREPSPQSNGSAGTSSVCCIRTQIVQKSFFARAAPLCFEPSFSNSAADGAMQRNQRKLIVSIGRISTPSGRNSLEGCKNDRPGNAFVQSSEVGSPAPLDDASCLCGGNARHYGRGYGSGKGPVASWRDSAERPPGYAEPENRIPGARNGSPR